MSRQKTPPHPLDLPEQLTTSRQQSLVPRYIKYAFVPADGYTETPDVYDGDTVTLALDLGHDVLLHPVYYRLWGINAPEIRPLRTRRAGTAAKEFLQELIQAHAIEGLDADEPWLGAGYWLIARTHKAKRRKDYRPRATRGKYGRFLVELFGQTDAGKIVNLNKMMLEAGHAVPYLD